MSDDARCFAEQDPTVARVAETSLRMMAGAVTPPTRKRIRAMAEGASAAYPWTEVVEAVLADPVDPSVLVQMGLAAQRDWVVRGGGAVAAASAPPPRSAPGLGYRLKRFLAVNLARLLFHAVFAVALIVLLILIRKTWPALDIYALADRVVEFARSLAR